MNGHSATVVAVPAPNSFNVDEEKDGSVRELFLQRHVTDLNIARSPADQVQGEQKQMGK